MRKVRVLFTGVNDLQTFVTVLACLERHGTVLCHHFAYVGPGTGYATVNTTASPKELEVAVGNELPAVMTGVEELKEECDDCQQMVA